MSFAQMIKRVQKYSGLGYSESKEALIMLVEVLAARMDDRDRRRFAQKLPERLGDIVLTVYPSNIYGAYDIVAQFMYYQNIGKARARRQILAAWQVIQEVSKEPDLFNNKPLGILTDA